MLKRGDDVQAVNELQRANCSVAFKATAARHNDCHRKLLPSKIFSTLKRGDDVQAVSELQRANCSVAFKATAARYNDCHEKISPYNFLAMIAKKNLRDNAEKNFISRNNLLCRPKFLAPPYERLLPSLKVFPRLCWK